MCPECGRNIPDKRMTLRQTQVVELLLQGLSNRDIGIELGLSERTVKAHLASIYRKRGLLRGNRIVLIRILLAEREANTPGSNAKAESSVPVGSSRIQ